jgi:hypothetical protein
MGGLRRLLILASWCVALPLVVHDSRAHEQGDCGGFTWDVSRELAAMRATPTRLKASAGAAGPHALIEDGQHFTAALLPQQLIAFVAPPGRASRSPSPMAGLLVFRSARAGAYRISLSSRHWIDVFDGNQVINSRAHQGRSSCSVLHKVVEFDLPAKRELTIQLSGDDADTVGIVVTAVEST